MIAVLDAPMTANRVTDASGLLMAKTGEEVTGMGFFFPVGLVLLDPLALENHSATREWQSRRFRADRGRGDGAGVNATVLSLATQLKKGESRRALAVPSRRFGVLSLVPMI